MRTVMQEVRRDAGEPAASPGRAERPTTARADNATLLTVIVPVYNEESTVGELLKRVVAAPYDKDLVVVDDGSTDGTAEVLAGWEGHPQIQLLQHSKNRGKGAAIRKGLELARGRFVIIQDADLEYDPQDYPLLIEPLLGGEAQVVYGSRALDRDPDSRRTWCLFRLGVSLLSFSSRLLYGARVTDEATCYKAFPMSVLRKMELVCERFEFCPEVTAKACRLGLRITEVPIRYEPRSVAEGKKILWTDGMQAFAVLWRWRKWRPSDTTAPNVPGNQCQAGELSRKLPRRESGFTVVELLVVITIISMLMALLLPAVMSSRNSARKLQCMNNLRNVAVAMLSDTEAKSSFPSGGCFGIDGTCYFSWVVPLLPYLERRDIAEQWDYEKAWDDPENMKLGSLHLPILACPNDVTALPGQGSLSYVVNSGIGWTTDRRGKDCPMAFHRTLPMGMMEPLDLNGNGVTCPTDPSDDGTSSDRAVMFQMGLIFAENWPYKCGVVRHHTPDTVLDGLSNTVMLSENVRAGYDPYFRSNWSTPFPRFNSFIMSGYVCQNSDCSAGNVDYRYANDRSDAAHRCEAINGNYDEPEGQAPFASSYHLGGVHVAFCDGHLQFMSEDIEGTVYAAMLSPQGTLINGPMAQSLLDATGYLH